MDAMHRIPALILLLVSVAVSAGEDDTADIADIFPNGRHRVDLGWTKLDGFDGDIYVLLPSYTYSWERQLRFTATTSVIELDILGGYDRCRLVDGPAEKLLAGTYGLLPGLFQSQ